MPGTSVAMDPPAGFALAEDFAGFAHPPSGSSVLVAELPPEAHAEIAPVFASEALARDALSPQGVTLEEIAPITVDGEPVDLVVGEQRAGTVAVDKYFVVLEGDGATVLVTVSAVGEAGPDRDAAVAALESVALLAPPTLAERVADLPFDFEPAAPFETRRVMAGAAVALATYEGTDPSGERPILVIASALGRLDSNDLQAASERLLGETVGFESAAVAEGERVTSGRALAWRVEARAGERLAIHYLWPLPRGRYLRLAAMGARAELEPLAGAVAAIAASVEPRGVAAR